MAFVFAAVASAGIWGLSVSRDRGTVLEAAEVKLSATARLLEQHAERALEAGERVVQGAVLAAGEPERLRDEGRAERLHRALRRLVEGSPQIASAWLLDAEGRAVAESRDNPPRSEGSFAHRAYVQAHQQGERGLHVGLLSAGSSSGRLRFTLSRPLLAQDGSFAGVAAAGVLSDYFADIYAEAGLGEGARLALFRADGVPLALWPPGPGGPEAVPAAGAAGSSPREITAIRDLARYPVRLVVSQPEAAVLAEWRTRSLASGATLAAVVLALGGLTVLGLRGARAQEALVRTLAAERAALERRVAERTAELAEGEAHLRDTLESMTDAYVALDREFRVVDANARALALDGRTAPEIMGRTHWEAWPGSVGTPVEAAYRRAMAERVPVRLEHRYRFDAQDVWLDIRAFPTATGLALFYADIGERKRAEAALRASEERRRLATEGAKVGIWEADLVTGQGQWSAEAVALLGVETGQCHADTWTGAIHPEDRARAVEAWRRAMEEGTPYEVEFRAAAPAGAGEERWLLSRGAVERDPAGRPVRAAGVLLDVTDRRRAEEETRAALAELRSVYDTAPIGLCVLDPEGRFVRINARLAEINGLPVEAHLGRRVREILPGIADAAEKLLRLVMESGEPVLGVEIEGETPARPGMRRVWEEHWYPLRDHAGRIIGVNVVAEEVTERKASEQRQFLLAREVDHRAKNALTMVQSVLRLTRAEDPRSFARAVEGRVQALARAQGLLAEVRWTGVELRALLAAELAAFIPPEDQAAGDPAAPGLHLEGPPVTLTPAASQPIAMMVHELATNATKYGALSTAGGRVSLGWQVDEEAGLLRLCWAEGGGPPVAAPPTRRGFGTKVIEAVVAGQLGGQVQRRWEAGGLVCDIALPLERTAVRPGGPQPATPLLALPQDGAAPALRTDGALA